MTDHETRKTAVELEYDLHDAPPKVWRAISVPEIRNNWLPEDALIDPEATAITPGEEIRYRMRDSEPPFLESSVTFLVGPNGSGGTRLRIVHELSDARLSRVAWVVPRNSASFLSEGGQDGVGEPTPSCLAPAAPAAANGNSSTLMLVA